MRPSQSFESVIDDQASVLFWPQFLKKLEADECFEALTSEISFHQAKIKMFGRETLEPRLTAWHGDKDAMYAYSGRSMSPQPWTHTLQKIKNKLEGFLEANFNSVLLNLYRHGHDSMGWHQDNESELGQEPFIASLSLGAERDFMFRKKEDHAIKVKVALKHGSLLVMRGQTQTYWQHALPRRARVFEPRLNLTFRLVTPT